MNPQIVCYQDTHLIDSDIDEMKSIWDGEIVLNGYKTNARGTAVMFSSNFEYRITKINKLNNGDILEIDFVTNDLNIKLIVIYAPNKDNPIFFETISDLIKISEQDYNIICGDFNIALNQELDTYNYKNINNPKAQKVLRSILTDHEMVDLYRHLNPKKKDILGEKPTLLNKLDWIISLSPRLLQI